MDAKRLHAEAIVIDTHADTPQRFVDEGWNFDDPAGDGMINLETATQGNLAAEFFAIWVEPKEWRGRFAHRTMQLIDGVYQQLARLPGRMRLGLSAGDIEQAHRDGVFCALMGIEGGHSIEADLGLLRLYYRLGVRYMTLTWANSNEWADSSGDVDDASVTHHGGLTAFGRKVVAEMNRLGMMVDVSHVSDETLADVLVTAKAPVLASHSCARALTNSPRNLTDEQLKAIAATGGAVMVNFYPAFLDEAWRVAWKAMSEERDALFAKETARCRERGEPVTYGLQLQADRECLAKFLREHPLPGLEVVADHIDHIARVGGIDHVGIGTDFDGISVLPAGLKTAADLPKLTEALMRRGYTNEQVKKVLGGNLLRVFREVEAARSPDAR